MTLEEFKKMDEEEQFEAFLFGIHIGFKVNYNLKIQCKQVNDFYVECIFKGNKFVRMRSHRDTKLIEPYLENMDIDFLH